MHFIALGLGVVWFLFTLGVLRNLYWSPQLPGSELLPAPERPWPVSIVLAGRDEGRRLEETVRRLFAQRKLDAQIVFVDDRSRDDTPEVAARLAAEFPTFETMRVETLPGGWLGKTHACHVGSLRARHPWILFCDADCHMCDDLVARAIAVAEREQADHVALFPGIDATGAVTRASVVAWAQYLILYAPAAQINRDRGRKAMGVGAFNLLRTASYRAIGGHEPLKMEVLDDVKLGVMVRRAGMRQRVYSAVRELEAEWAGNLWQMIKNLEKNWFAGVEYRLGAAVLLILMLFAAWGGAMTAPLWSPGWGWIALAGVLSTAIPGTLYVRRSGWPLWTGLLVPFCHVAFPIAGINSTWKTMRQGGVRWRDTFYPLAELRAGIVRYHEVTPVAVTKSSV
jgi:hypothetical protein